jgi:hypothetical protein
MQPSGVLEQRLPLPPTQSKAKVMRSPPFDRPGTTRWPGREWDFAWLTTWWWPRAGRRPQAGKALVEADRTIRYVSLHQYPWYPGTGAADERGVGNIFNVPRGPGKPASLYVGDLWAAIVAATMNWAPDVVFISAGFDAMKGDPLGGFTLEPEHYADWTLRSPTPR